MLAPILIAPNQIAIVGIESRKRHTGTGIHFSISGHQAIDQGGQTRQRQLYLPGQLTRGHFNGIKLTQNVLGKYLAVHDGNGVLHRLFQGEAPRNRTVLGIEGIEMSLSEIVVIVRGNEHFAVVNQG